QTAIGSNEFAGPGLYGLFSPFAISEDYLALIQAWDSDGNGNPNDGHTMFGGQIFSLDGPDDGICTLPVDAYEFFVVPSSPWIDNGWFTATASGTLVSRFVFDSSDGHIHNYDLGLDCHLTVDNAAPSGTINPGGTARNLTAGTERDGAVYLFNTAGSPH